MRRRWSLAFLALVLVVAALAAAAVFSMRPTLEEAEDVAARRWDDLRPALDARYDVLGSLVDAGVAARPEVDLLGQTSDALAAWDRRSAGAGLAGGPALANRVEALAGRLATAIVASATLSEDPEVLERLSNFLAARPTDTLDAYNDAVRRYDDARSRFPGRFFAGLLGFDDVRTVEIPEVLDDLDVPAPPPTSDVAPPDTPQPDAPDAAAEPAEGAEGGAAGEASQPGDSGEPDDPGDSGETDGDANGGATAAAG